MKIDAYYGNVSYSKVMGSKALKKSKPIKNDKAEYKYRVEKRGQYIDVKI